MSVCVSLSLPLLKIYIKNTKISNIDEKKSKQFRFSLLCYEYLSSNIKKKKIFKK